MNSSSRIHASLNNTVIDGDFMDADSVAWKFEKAVPESLAAREVEGGNPYFTSSISGSATQLVSGITASTLYTLTVNTRGSEKQSDAQSRNPTGYIGVKGGELDLRFYVEGVHDWKKQKMRFRSSPGTDSLQITAFGVSGTMDFDDISLSSGEEVIDPEELLRNGSFHQEEEHWRLLTQSEDAQAQIIQDEGNLCFLAANLGSASQSVACAPDKTYILTFKCKATGRAEGDPCGQVSIRGSAQGGVEQPLKVTNSWEEYRLEYTVANVVGNGSLSVRATGGAMNKGAITYFDQFSLKLKA